MRQMTVYLIALLSLFACKETDEPLPEPATNCDQFVIVGAEQFDEAADDFHVISRAEIVGDCLEVDFTASGCNGDRWEVTLIDSEAVAESFPVQRSIRLSLNNPELCQAIFMQTHSFDLAPTQIEAYDTIIFNLEGWEDALRYEY